SILKHFKPSKEFGQEDMEWVAQRLKNALMGEETSKESYEEVSKQIRNSSSELPVVLCAGWDWHAFTYIFWNKGNKNFLIVNNKGADSNENAPLEIFEIPTGNLETLTPEKVMNITNRLALRRDSYQKSSDLVNELKAQSIAGKKFKHQ